VAVRRSLLSAGTFLRLRIKLIEWRLLVFRFQFCLLFGFLCANNVSGWAVENQWILWLWLRVFYCFLVDIASMSHMRRQLWQWSFRIIFLCRIRKTIATLNEVVTFCILIFAFSAQRSMPSVCRSFPALRWSNHGSICQKEDPPPFIGANTIKYTIIHLFQGIPSDGGMTIL